MFRASKKTRVDARASLTPRARDDREKPSPVARSDAFATRRGARPRAARRGASLAGRFEALAEALPPARAARRTRARRITRAAGRRRRRREDGARMASSRPARSGRAGDESRNASAPERPRLRRRPMRTWWEVADVVRGDVVRAREWRSGNQTNTGVRDRLAPTAASVFPPVTLAREMRKPSGLTRVR